MTLRIAQVCRVGWPSVGGMETVVHDLSRALIGRGHRVEVFTLQRAPTHERTLLPAGVHEGVRYHRLPMLGLRRYPFAVGLRRAVRDFDVVHVHGLDGLADILVGGAVPVGVSTHGGFLHTDRLLWLKRLTLRTLTRRTLGRADAVWFTSASDRRALSPARASGPVIQDGVSLADFLKVKRRPKPHHWMVPGRIAPHKGIDDLVSMLGRIRSRLPSDWRLDVLGAGDDAALVQLREQVECLQLRPHVQFRNGVSRPALFQAMATAERAILPSRYEGFGLTLVECMAANIPVIASDIAPHRARMGETGVRFNMRTPGAAEKLLAALTTAPLSGEAAVKLARQYDWSERIGEYEAAYRALVAR